MIKNKIKLSVTDSNYIVDEKNATVTCTMSFKLKTNSDIENAFMRLMGEYPHYEHEVTATAYLAEGDTFDLKKGMQVARAKAELAAYEKVQPLVTELINSISKMDIPLTDFEAKAYRTIEHNKEYIKSF